ncbi:hypothetical protein [Hydrogenophaga sp. 5NK40-0174]|uniref:hypothetical protein n=1 Tax=Hydrogenophaga sp. 5NK40-0174 TaxID=3127649 RepID=UPI00310C4E43
MCPQSTKAIIYGKTAKGWSALPEPRLLRPHEHTVMVMANGQRSLAELSQLLGATAEPIAIDLEARGYLKPAEACHWDGLDA